MIKILTVREIVDQLGGEVVGNPTITVTGVGSIQNACSGQLTFFSDAKFVSYIPRSEASVVVVTAENADKFGQAMTKIIVENPHLYFAQTLNLLFSNFNVARGVDATASISDTAVLGIDVAVGSQVVVEDGAEIGEAAVLGSRVYVGKDAKIGRNTILHPGAIVLDGCEIGENCVIHSGSVIGGDGFGYVHDNDQWIKVPQVGRVLIKDNCEIGCNTTIDRGAIDDTVIGAGVKIDNQVQIGHNCMVGDNTIISGCVGIAGSVVIGKNCRIGGAAMFTGHLSVCDNVDISAGSLVSKSILNSGRYTSVYPLSEHGAWKKNASAIRHLSELNSRIKKLEVLLSKASSEGDSQ